MKTSFLSYTNSDVKEIKKLRNEVLEALSIEQLNAIYSPKEAPTHVPTVSSAILPFNQQTLPIAQMQPVADTLASMEKFPGLDKIQIKVKKPIKVVFQDDTQTSKTSSEPIAPVEERSGTVMAGMAESATVEDEKVIISLDNTNDDSDDSYDFLSSAPKLDLTSDIQELEDIVRDNSQGMMPSVVTVSNMTPNIKPMSRSMRPLIAEHDNIRSIEDDPDGWSVIGMSNDFGSVKLPDPKK